MERMEKVRALVPSIDAIMISSLTGEGMDRLRRAISGHFAYPVEMNFFLPRFPGSGTVHLLAARQH